MDSENILQLLNKYSQGLTTSEEETMLLDFLQNNPDVISEEGYDELVDKLVYEHSLLERKALFQEMMKTPPSSFFQTYFWPILISGVLLFSGGIYVATKQLKSNNNNSIVKEKAINLDTVITVKKDNVTENFVSNQKIIQTNQPINSTVSNTENTSLKISNQTISNQKQTTIVQPELAVPISKINNAVIKNEGAVNQNEIQITPAKACPNYTKLVTVKTSKSETNQNNGIIKVITSNTNLNFSIDNENFNTYKTFENLSPGKYTLYIQDNVKCSNTIANIIVTETTCISDYKKDMVQGETWQIPILLTDVKSIIIYNTSGQIVYKQNQFVSKDFEWNGTTNQGNQLVVGLYKVVVTYQKESCIFNVSILD